MIYRAVIKTSHGPSVFREQKWLHTDSTILSQSLIPPLKTWQPIFPHCKWDSFFYLLPRKTEACPHDFAKFFILSTVNQNVDWWVENQRKMTKKRPVLLLRHIWFVIFHHYKLVTYQQLIICLFLDIQEDWMLFLFYLVFLYV